MESLYAAQAIRMVQILGLPRRLSAHRIQREVEIRVWWTTWMMDTWTSASMGIPRQLGTEPDYETPMEEMSFDRLDQNPEISVNYEIEQGGNSPREMGLWTQMIPLTTIMGEIHILNKKAVSTSGHRLQILEEVKQLSFKLDYWLSCLPESLHNTVENLERYAKQGLGRTFAALHFGYHYHAQLLYYQFLHRASEPCSRQDSSGLDDRSGSLLAHKYAARCKKHASELSSLMWITNTTPGLECLWPINGHLLVIASSVHLHTILFEEDASLLTAARCMLEHNFMMLQQMQKYWPCLEFSTSRLNAFHRACQDSMLESFDMDDWMLNFLQEYAMPVSDRFGGFGTEFGGTPESWSPTQFSELHRELMTAVPTRGGLGDLLNRVS
ncbi:hypothetical protein PV11_09419 [Exophiala sideris]|uniref:Xylanolytic transcriptional activator regulatory domain-containing protein n=1 Tax=Exophiala sideris TaxID=1016849 RepID=A0A0D1WRB6_9EURO|nr:hypothetical protein PV11_09419 [Exophiala sideris]